MEKPHLKKRHRMRKKDISKLEEQLELVLGISLGTKDVDSGDLGGETVYIVDNQIVAIDSEQGPYLTLRGLLKYTPKRYHVTVDDGAVSFLYNGADVMSPGVLEADPDIQPGDIVWVKEIKHGRPLVIGKALVTGPEMVDATKGKAIKTIWYLNDDLWNVET